MNRNYEIGKLTGCIGNDINVMVIEINVIIVVLKLSAVFAPPTTTKPSVIYWWLISWLLLCLLSAGLEHVAEGGDLSSADHDTGGAHRGLGVQIPSEGGEPVRR